MFLSHQKLDEWQSAETYLIYLFMAFIWNFFLREICLSPSIMLFYQQEKTLFGIPEMTHWIFSLVAGVMCVCVYILL